MAQMSKEEMMKVVSDNIEVINNKEFNVYFYVIDKKGYYDGELEYIYETALTLKRRGYNVTMIHCEDDFVGVEDWLGKSYSELPHKNINKENVPFGKSDFVVIPEYGVEILEALKEHKFKKVLLVYNFEHLCQIFPLGVTPANYGVTDAIVSTERNAQLVMKYFPDVRVQMVHPVIKKMFRNNTNERELKINIISENAYDYKRIMNKFYWKYPVYRWITFLDLRCLKEEVFADALRSSVMTICVDNKTNLGLIPAESIVCGNYTFFRVPERPTEWMLENGELCDPVIWFDDDEVLIDKIASFVRTWTLDKIPADIDETIKKGGEMLKERYSIESHEKEVEEAYEKGLFERRRDEYKEVLKYIGNKEN